MAGSRPPVEVRVMALVVLLIPTVAIYFPLGLTPGFALLGLPALALAWRRRAMGRVDPLLAAALAGLLAWSLVTALWSEEPLGSVRKTAMVAGLAAGGLAVAAALRGLDEVSRRWLTVALAAGMALGLALTAAELASGGILLRMQTTWTNNVASVMKRGNTVALLLVWPTSAALVALGHRRLAVALAAGWLGVLAFSFSDSAKLGMAAGLAALALARPWPRLGARLAAVGIAAVILAAPLVAIRLPSPPALWETRPDLKFSVHHRLTIWSFAGGRIAERPVLGWGMDASRWIPGSQHEWIFFHPGSPEPYREANMPLHPHNVALQWWLELGLPGALLAALALAAVARLAGRLSGGPWRPALAVAALAATFGMELVSYGAWQSWWLASLGIAAALWTLSSSHRETGP